MHSETVVVSPLTSNDVSYILNLICPRCGGSLGGPSQEFKCQGHCRTDWRHAWESSRTVRMLNRARRRTRKSGSANISSIRHPWR
jgi:hypothetical protein